MRIALLAPLLLAAVALAGSVVQFGLLKFYEVSSLSDLESYLASHNGPVLLFVHEEGCPACDYMISQVFTQPSVADAVGGMNLVAVDITYVPVTSLTVYANGSIFVVENGQAGYTKPLYGQQTLPIIGTPTTVVGYDEGGKLYVKGVLLGGLPPEGFLEFLNYSFGGLPQPAAQASAPSSSAQLTASASGAGSAGSPLFALPMAFAVGAASVFSPCVLPVLTVSAVTLAARRSLPKILLGMVASFAAFGALVAALGQAAAGLKSALAGLGGAVLLALGLVLLVPQLERRFVVAMSGLQTKASKAARGAGDVALGLSLGAVWTPCIAPFMGFAAVSALISGNFLDGFAIMLAYAAGLAATIYAVLRAVLRWGRRAATKSYRLSRWGRRLELIVGAASIALGALLIAEALGLGAWSAFFGSLQSLL
nr:MAG: cytochrome C biogenesis protein [Thermoproteus sp. AZ2]